MGGACENCQEVGNSKFVNVMAACFGVMLCHDSEFTGINQALFDTSVPSGYGPLASLRPHTQAIEDENAIGGFRVYNNWVHDTYARINHLCRIQRVAGLQQVFMFSQHQQQSHRNDFD